MGGRWKGASLPISVVSSDERQFVFFQTDVSTFFSSLSQIFIKDVKSSNGTFINGERLSQEGVESEPFELKTGDTVVSIPQNTFAPASPSSSPPALC